jgi:hypothetical protein
MTANTMDIDGEEARGGMRSQTPNGEVSARVS